MADTRFAPRLRTCSWCGDEVHVETVPGHERRSRQWVPGTDRLHHHTLKQVTAYGDYLRDLEAEAQQQLAAARRPQPAPAAPQPPTPPLPPPPPSPPTELLEYGNEAL